jgi:hypothetical protein
MAQGGVGLPPGDVDLVDGGPGPQGLDYRVAPLDEAVGLGLQGAALIFMFTHGKNSFCL